MRIDCNLKHIGKNGSVIKEFVGTEKIPAQGIWEQRDFLSKKMLRENADNFLPEGALKLDCEIAVLKIFNTITHEKEVFDRLKKLSCKEEDRKTSSLIENLKRMWKNSLHVDFKLVCDSYTFPCHRAVLACRSDVFETMFSHDDSREVLSGQAVIKETKQEVLSNFLEFLYTDHLDDKSGFNSADLLILADKYNVVSLKSECEISLSKSIECPNAIQLLHLSTCISVPKLLKTSARFVAGHRDTLFGSTDWNELIKNNPEALEAIIQFGV